MKKIINFFIPLLILLNPFVLNTSLSGQSFIQLDDLSGYKQNVASHLIDSLDDTSTKINEVIMLNSSVNDFQVFDFGFYRHSTSFEDGIPEILALVKSQVETTTSNYFLIAHQINEEGELARIWTFLKLDTDDLICLNDSLLSFDLQYFFDENINNQKININQGYDLKHKSLKLLHSILQEGYCCSEYEQLKKSASRSGEISFEALECMEDFGFLSELYDQLKIDTVFHDLVEQVKIISELFSICRESGYLKPLAKNGIVPMCFWTFPGLEDFPININNPLNDNACACGAIDGISAELIETFNFIQAIPDVLNYPDRLIRSYLSYYLYCEYGVLLSPYQVNILLDWFFDDESLNPTFKATILALASYRSNILRAIDYFFKPSEEQCREHEERILQFEMMASILLHPLAFEMFVINLIFELVEVFSIIGWETPRERYWLCHYLTRVGVNLAGLPKGTVKAAQLKAYLLAKDFSSSRLIINQRVRRYLSDLYISKLKDLPSYKKLLPWEKHLLKDDFLNNPNGLKAVYKGDLVGAWKFAIDCPREVRNNTAILEGIAAAIKRGPKSIEEIVSYANHPAITNKTVRHIFTGDSGGGRHHISAILNDNNRKLVNRLEETSEGFYGAVFSSGGRKSFWPDSWDEFRVIDELKYVLSNPNYSPKLMEGNFYRGKSQSGQYIGYYLTGDDKIISAFPILPDFP